MELLFFCPRWGSEHLSWQQFCYKVSEAGYQGIEAGVPFDAIEYAEMKKALQQTGLLLIGQYWQSFEDNVAEEATTYVQYLQHIATLHPIKINAQTGRDFFSEQDNTLLFKSAAEFEVAYGVPVLHETHRNKALYAAHVAKQYLLANPYLQITADFSHWCTVAESFLEDQQAALQLAIRHTQHIHARVGHTQGPQVPDPRAPQWHQALQAHMQWWQAIVTRQKKSGAGNITITPEFGPYPYMVNTPQEDLPVANQWELNVWMMQYLKNYLET